MAGLQRIVISSRQRSSGRLQLEPEQTHYLRRVLRLRRGDRFIALDEQDKGWVAELNSGSGATVIASYGASTELACRVTLQIGMPKTGMDDIVRQTTELGIYAIQPVISDRVILKPSAHKLERWQRIAQEAAEQAERQHWPRVGDVVSFDDAVHAPSAEAELAQLDAAPTLLVRYICAARRPASHLLTRLMSAPIPQMVTLAVGPEGGWTEREIDCAIAAGYEPINLGSRILRAATAPAAAMALVAAACEGAADPSDRSISPPHR